MMRKYLIFFIAPCLFGNAQEKQGISNSNYSSSNSIFLNPSSSVDSRTFIQLNLVGANAFMMTDIVYLPKFSVWRFMKNPGVPAIEKSELSFQKYLFANAGATGPVLVVSKGNFGFGAFARMRMVVNVRRMPPELTSLLFLQQTPGLSETELNISRAGFSGMTWMEYGGNFGMIILKRRDRMMSAGANLKYLSGINIVYAQMDELKGRYNSDLIRIDTLRGRLKYNQVALGSGRGFGGDLGFTFKKMLGNVDGYYAHSKRSGCRHVDYKYKFAFSLRDLGYIRYNTGTQVADYNASGYFYINTGDPSSRQATNLQVNTPLRSEAVSALLPASFSAQYDYNFENSVYLNITAVKNLVPGRFTGVQSPDILVICPRFETKNIEIGLPLTFQRFMYPQLGFAFRLRSFVIGLDNLLPLLVAKDTYGVGAYVSLGVSIFNNPACSTRSPRVSDCPAGDRKPDRLRKYLLRRIFGRNKTYSR